MNSRNTIQRAEQSVEAADHHVVAGRIGMTSHDTAMETYWRMSMIDGQTVVEITPAGMRLAEGDEEDENDVNPDEIARAIA
jgi:hypothetical protein